MDELEVVDRHRFPLTTHDIFGYLVPGATLIILLYVFEFWCKMDVFTNRLKEFHTPVCTALRATVVTDGANWAFMLLYVLSVLGVSYVIGHIVASIAVFFLDRILVGKGYGYPFRTLLAIPLETGLKGDVSAPFYRGIFFWFNLYLLIRYAMMFHSGGILGPIATVLGWLLATIILVKMVVSPFGRRHWPEATKFFWMIFAYPYDLLGNLIARYTRTRSSFSAAFIEEYTAFFRQKFGATLQEANTGIYWLTSIYVKDHAPHLAQEINWFHYLYSFSRNLAAAFYLAYLYCFFSIRVQIANIQEVASYDRVVMTLLPGVFLVVAFILLARYYYLFFSKNSRLLLRTFYYLCRKERSWSAPVAFKGRSDH